MKFRTLFAEFRWKFIFIFALILLESIIELLFPLFIGFAIDGALQGEFQGAVQLGGLGLAVIVIGGGRKFFDSRFYAQVYRKLGREALANIEDDQPSLKTARLGMIQEIVEFMAEMN